MPTHPYYAELEKHLFAELVGVRKRARQHKLTIRTFGKDCQPKTFQLCRNGQVILCSAANSLRGIKWYLDQLEGQAAWAGDRRLFMDEGPNGVTIHPKGVRA